MQWDRSWRSWTPTSGDWTNYLLLDAVRSEGIDSIRYLDIGAARVPYEDEKPPDLRAYGRIVATWLGAPGSKSWSSRAGSSSPAPGRC
jgi:hypothetical protein